MKKYFQFMIVFLMLFWIVSCDTRCSESVDSIGMQATKSGSSKMDVSFRVPGSATQMYRNRSIDWYYLPGSSSGAYVLCVWNQDSSGTVTATINVQLENVCTTTTTDEETGETESESSSSVYVRSTSDTDSVSVCISVNVGG